MNPWIVIAAFLAVGAGGFKLGIDHELAQQSREDKLVQKAEDAMTKTAANAIAEIKPKYTTIQGKLEKQIETNNVYHDCKLDPVGLQLVNQALRGGTEAVAGGKLPNPDGSAK